MSDTIPGEPGARWPWPVDMVQGGERGGRVLIVDDDAAFRALAARALAACGHVTAEAASAEAALEMVAGPGVSPDLVVSDVALPGLDGPVWIREARIARPDLPVILVSGYSEALVAERFARLEGCVFLEKPFPLERLTRAARAELSRVAAARRLAQRSRQHGKGSSGSGVAA